MAIKSYFERHFVMKNNEIINEANMRLDFQRCKARNESTVLLISSHKNNEIKKKITEHRKFNKLSISRWVR